jgi:hypothetical protein
MLHRFHRQGIGVFSQTEEAPVPTQLCGDVSSNVLCAFDGDVFL